MTIRVCVDCAYFAATALLSRGECRRYPVTQMKSESEWCGEFVAKVKAGEPHPSETSGSTKSSKPIRLNLKESTPNKVVTHRVTSEARVLDVRFDGPTGYDANGSPTE